MKTCLACHTPKFIDAFYRHPTTRDGRFTRCIECLNAATKPYQRERYHKNKGSSIERQNQIEINTDRKRERAAEVERAKRLAHATRFGTE